MNKPSSKRLDVAKRYLISTPCFIKTNDPPPLTKLPITSANVDRFSKFFTFVLNSDCVMNWSLTIPSHLKRVDTLPCKTLVLKIDLISTLINTSCSLFVVHHELVNRIIVSLDIWTDIVIYPAISHPIIFYKFSWSLSFPRAVSTLTFCASFAPRVGKCNNVRDP